jgi:signal recognition particle GTPase
METNICNKCKIEKELIDFYKSKSSKDGYNGWCKICLIEKTNKWRKNNRDKLNQCSKNWYQNNKDKKSEYFEKYRLESSEKLKETGRKYREKNKEIIKQKKKIYNENYKQKRNELRREKLKTDILFKLVNSVRSRLRKYLKTKNITKKNTTFEIVGCTPQELKEHLEKQFVDGMGWENRFEWHIDHIIPLSSAKTEEELYTLCHYTNLQPLWAIDNLKKSNNIL